MNPDYLFIGRCRQLEKQIESEDPLEILDIAGTIRQLLFDTSPLVDTVNKGKIKIRFTVAKPSPELSDAPGTILFYQPLAGFDFVPEHRVSLNRDMFLKHSAFRGEGGHVTVREVVKHAIIVAGAVHHTPNPDAEYKTIAERMSGVYLGSMPARLELLVEIAEVVLIGLQPLIEDVKHRNGC